MRISDWSSDVCSSDLRKPQRMAQPVFVVAFRVFLEGMGATAFETVCRRFGGGQSDFDHVGQFQSLDARGVEYLGLVLERNVGDTLGERLDRKSTRLNSSH